VEEIGQMFRPVFFRASSPVFFGVCGYVFPIVQGVLYAVLGALFVVRGRCMKSGVLDQATAT
jgi:hypothetical protein